MLSNYSIKRLEDKKIAILGLGKEGLSTLKFLKKNKINPKILDIKLNNNYLKNLNDFEIIFRTPGFPRLHPALIAAEKKGILVTSHIKLFFDLCPAKIIGITGTKGKTTTASLIYEILKTKYGKRVFLAGNIGRPALDILPKLKKDSLVVLELSSFQLQDLYKSPHVAVITNITSDHMDPTGKFWPSTHQTQKEYFEAKMHIIKHQNRDDFAFIHRSLKNRTKDIGQGKKIFPTPLRPGDRFKTRLIGRHNLENIALAAAVGKIFKVSDKKISEAIKNFKGIEHRLELVAKINGISFYNDSIATNPDATLAALKSFKEPIHLILGGSDKGLDYEKLIKYTVRSKNIKTVVLIGQLKNKLYQLFKNFQFSIFNFQSNSNFQLKKTKTLRDAVLTCYKNSGKNNIVLLSPAAASFDMFANYAERGEKFKKLVKQLRRTNDGR